MTKVPTRGGCDICHNCQHSASLGAVAPTGGVTVTLTAIDPTKQQLGSGRFTADETTLSLGVVLTLTSLSFTGGDATKTTQFEPQRRSLLCGGTHVWLAAAPARG